MIVLIEIINLSKGYYNNPVIHQFNLTVKKGQFVGITGPSGCGKTTLAKCILGIEKPDSGKILINNNEKIQKKDQFKYQYIFQNPYLSLNPKIKVGKQIIEGALHHKLCKEPREYLMELMKFCHLDFELKDRYPNELSIGQSQRVAIARTFALKPELIICDEITSAQDKETARELLKILKEYHQKKKATILFISHEITSLNLDCDEIINMK